MDKETKDETAADTTEEELRALWEEARLAVTGPDHKERPPRKPASEQPPEKLRMPTELFAKIGQLMIQMKRSQEYAEMLSKLLHSDEASISDIQEILEKQPIGATSLLYLINIERAKAPGDLEKDVRSRIGKEAVSHRRDMQLKALWHKHCQHALDSGETIRTLGDLLDLPGYEPEIAGKTPETLKRWAREAGIAFSHGRPKKKRQ